MEWAYAREAMRRIGFSADDLFFAVNDIGDGEHIVSLVLQAQGKKFTWGIGKSTASKDELSKAYEKLCQDWNSSGEFDVEGFRESDAFKQGPSLMLVLHLKGFKLNLTKAKSEEIFS